MSYLNNHEPKLYGKRDYNTIVQEFHYYRIYQEKNERNYSFGVKAKTLLDS